VGMLMLKPALLDLRQAREVTDYKIGNPRTHHSKYHNYLIHCHQKTTLSSAHPHILASPTHLHHYDLHQNNHSHQLLLIITTIISFVYVFILDRILSCMGG